MTNTSNNSNASTVATPTVSREDLIALGRYDSVNEDIRYVPLGQLGTDPKLFPFERVISVEEAAGEMERLGYKHASFADLLDFGIKNPEEQRTRQIVAMGSSVELHGLFGYDASPSLEGNASHRHLSTVDSSGKKGVSFLGVRK